MNWKGHAITNEIVLLLLVYLFVPIDYICVLTGVFIAPLSALFPDFDLELRKLGIGEHRDILFHSSIFGIIPIPGFLFLHSLDYLLLTSLFAVGYGNHLFFDYFPKFKLIGYGRIHIFKEQKTGKFSLGWLVGNTIVAMGLGILILWLY
jgi:hypothetical protein